MPDVRVSCKDCTAVIFEGDRGQFPVSVVVDAWQRHRCNIKGGEAE